MSARPANRAHKERFILSFGKIRARTGNDAVSTVLNDYGLELFPDWAIDLMVEDLIRDARSANRRLTENRRIYAALQAITPIIQAAE